MRYVRTFALAAWGLLGYCGAMTAAEPASPLAPFQPDDHTVLLYHFDEGRGTTAHDAGRHAYTGEVRGATWCPGKFGAALEFDGRDDSVFRELTPAMENLRTITVECWFAQENPQGRRFLLGKDVTLHWDLSDAAGSSISIYHKGSAEANAEGLRHQQVGAAIGSVRPGVWHHLAATYDGRQASFFLDGVLKARNPAARDFLLGVRSRGLWIGSYVGSDYWFSGRIDEVRISDCVRYDPEGKLAVGGRVFDVPRNTFPPRVVRPSRQPGRAKVRITLQKSFGDNAAGLVSIKPPGRPAMVVGRFDLDKIAPGKETVAEFDVSDALAAEGTYLLALENERTGYFALTAASMTAGGRPIAAWSGRALGRRTFAAPILAPLCVGVVPPAKAAPVVLLPEAADRTAGALELDRPDPSEPPRVSGRGLIEYWLVSPTEQTYRVYLRYTAAVRQPCDIVIDGVDLNRYTMCAVNRSVEPTPRGALWEYQGTTTLSAGPHWLRIQDMLPDVVALRLEPVPAAPAPVVPWQRYATPDGDFLAHAGSWRARAIHGEPNDASMTLTAGPGPASLRFQTVFTNTDRANLEAGDAVRLVHSGQWDLEPLGRLRFRYEGKGSGHVVALWATDVRGEEHLLWRMRDRAAGVQDIRVPVSFEGNTVFDPAHVTALAWELDEGNVRADEVHRFSGTITAPTFDRRDALSLPPGHGAAVASARAAMASSTAPGAPSATLRARGFRPWTQPVVPEEHPQFAATQPRPVTRKTLGYDLHTTGARSIDPATLDQFHKHYPFGDVCWPHIGICPQRKQFSDEAAYRKALAEMEKRLVDVRDRGLLLFDIWGYVPYDPAYPHTIAPDHHAILLRVFGDRFLGYDNGEQDGRYIGSYADRGKARNRKEAWDDFVRWDEHIGADGMNYFNATGSLNFSHYYGERACRMLGLETAQGLPSDTLMFAFLRGAGKQYGRLIYQASSIWSRFGYNMYNDRRTDGAEGYGLGPNKGCSLSLHKRLFFCGYLDGHSIFGTETSQFTADEAAQGVPELSPLGRQHIQLSRWAQAHPARGVLYTPVAFLLDFHNGWNMPRHLYRGEPYRIWGKFPYEKGDYLIDGMFRMIWPGYQDASYLRNERGFVTPTPFGDGFDVVTDRCPPAVLRQYAAVMLLGDVEIRPDLAATLAQYVRAGGDLIVDVPAARALGQTLAGVQFGEKATGCMSRLLPSGRVFEESPYAFTVLSLRGAQPLLTDHRGRPLATVHAVGKGRLVVGAVDAWMTDKLTYRHPEIVHMEPPYQLLNGLKAMLGDYFDSFGPIELQPAGLNVHTCCYDGEPQRLLVGLINNDLFADWHGTVAVRSGPIALARDLWTGRTLGSGPRIRVTVPAGDAAILDIRRQ